MMGEDSEVAPEIIAKLRGLGVPFFRSPERALRALARLSTLQAPQPAPPTAEAERAGKRLPSGVIPEYAAKRILADAGIPVPRAELVTDLHDAQLAAARIGYPVVLKAQSSGLAHKSDVGGVVLGIADDAALVKAWHKLHTDVANARPDLQLDGILVEALAPPGVELLVGARNDPDWGPILVVGLGGAWTEVLRDVRVVPAFLDPSTIVNELCRLKGASLLIGYRGAPALDLRAAAEIVARLGRFARAHPEIAEVDINPVVVYPEQEGAVAVDALIVAR
jgi:acyl-CoA synthetase (NDP forming)